MNVSTNTAFGIFLATLTLAAGALSAQKSYTGVFRASSAGHYYAVLETPSQVKTRASALAKSGLRVTSLQCYRDARGVVLCDTVYNPGSGNQSVVMGQTLALFKRTRIILRRAGLHLRDLSTYTQNDGTRIYNGVFRPALGSTFFTWQTTSQMVSTWKTESSGGRRLSVLESYYDKAGVLRFDTVYHVGTGGYALWIGDTAAGIAAQDATLQKSGLNLVDLDSYFDASNVQRFVGVWRTGVPKSRFFAGQSQATFWKTWRQYLSAGWRLYHLEVSFEGAQPVRRNYGTGLAGRNGVPSLTLQSAPTLGRSNAIVMGNSRGVSTAAMLFLGTRALDVPLFGGRLLAEPLISLPTIVAATGSKMPVFTPADPTMDGLKLYLQLAEFDPVAPQSISLSRGLEIVHGRRD